MKSVLIADDESSIRLLVRVTIESDQYQVVEAADGDEAWSIMERHHPVLAILDVHMPGKTGLDLARAIKGTPDLAPTHVILLTSQAQEIDVAAGLAAGADRYLTKPFSPLELLAIVEQVLDA